MLVYIMIKNNSIFPLYINCIFYLISAILFSYFLDMGAVDDGLRHIAFSANSEIMKSWGEVFPYSLFNNYDPWFSWHFILSKFLLFFSYEQTQYIVNTLALFILMLLIDNLIREYIKYKLDSFIYILVLIIVVLSSFRYVMLRPDMLSGFFVMIAILLKNRFFTIFFLTLLYGPSYYLFFLYTGSIGLVYLIQQKMRAFLGVFSASILSLIFFLFHDMNGYIQTVLNILNDQNLRMGAEVLEGKPIFEFLTNINYFILLPSFLVIALILVYKNYEYFKSNTLASLLLITSILWLNQYRYFHLFLPLIFVYFLSIVFNANKKVVFYKLRKLQVVLKRFFSYSKNKKSFYLIALPYSLFMLAYIYGFQSVTQKVEEGKIFENNQFNEKIILSNTMNPEMFSILYYNPTIKTIPSCSIGWFEHKNKHLKQVYIDMVSSKGISEEKLKELIFSTNADIYLHYTNLSKEVLDFDKLESFGIIPKKIYKNKILFEVKK